jgi:dienelactone hydrolase
MNLLRLILTCSTFWAATITLRAQNYAPPPSRPPDAATRKAIEEKLAKLNDLLRILRQQSVRDPWYADVEIYRKAALGILQRNEFYQPDSTQWTLDVLDRGMLRAHQLASGETPWVLQYGQSVVRAFRSRIDLSLQPYAVTWPKEYATDVGQKWRLDLVLHGRDPSLTEIKFLHDHAGDAPEPDADYIRLDVFGRGNNGYRWAGETDVREVLEHFLGVEEILGRKTLVDSNRVVLRGFSMGGAGTWHIGLHYPDRWCLLGPGAGFTTTHGYVKGLPNPFPSYQERCLRIYDAVDYAPNAFNVPVVAYAGADDPQLQAAKEIEARLKPLGIPMKLLVAPGLAHVFPPEWQKKAQDLYSRIAPSGKGRPEYPDHVRFVTYTLKYDECFWVQILGLDRHYEEALVDATATDTGFKVTTKNVRNLRLTMRPGSLGQQVVNIDNQEVTVTPHVSQSGGGINIYLTRHGSQWFAVRPQRLLSDRIRRIQKLTGIQGPIDDAFVTPFLCVRGTGTPWHEASKRYADANLERFRTEWGQYFRGELPVKDDTDISDDDIATKNLILFGDPASNSLIPQILDALPLTWTKETLAFTGGKSFDAAVHVPVLIYPSPMNPEHYIVINSGHTFHAEDFLKTNALLYPRLGDYAVLKLTAPERDPLATEVVQAGLFDDTWQVSKEGQ